MLLDIPVTYYWTAAAGAAALFWAVMVPWMPTRRSRWRIAAVPLVMVLPIAALWAEGVPVRAALAFYDLVLVAVVLHLRPFHRWFPRAVVEEERSGHDPRHRRVRDLPLAFRVWSFLVWLVIVPLIFAAAVAITYLWFS